MNPIPAASALRARPLVVPAITLAVAATLSAALLGCGGGTEQAPPGETQTQTPPTGTSEATAAVDGAKIYADRCALCHGATGHGDGPASAGLDPKPRNHTDGAYMNTLSQDELRDVVRNGKGAMPAWKDVLTEAEIEAVLGHVRSLARPPYPG